VEFSENGLRVTRNLDSEDFRCNLVPERGTVQQKVPDRCTGSDEKYADAMMLGVPLYSGKGRSLGVVCVFDHPNRRFEEREIHVVEIYAQYVAHELSRRMLEKQLRQAQEMRVLGQLTSGVAHEVRNPLNAIQAIMEALEVETGGNADIRPFLAHIHQQVDRLSTLMEDLLQLGRCPRNLQPVRVSVMEMLQKTVHSWIESALPRNRKIEIIRGNDDERWVYVDIDKMNQVFINLIENALQHSPTEAPVVVTVQPSEGSDVVISIRDRGTGVQKEELQQVFEPFFSKRRNGTGLGLSIVKHLIESHGGRIVLRNNEGEPGLTADVYLPEAGDE
jgi:signal transduction histidine kinase